MSIRLYLILVLAMVSVSSTSLVIRYVTVVPALTLAFWRMLSASGMLWGYSLASSCGSLSPINKKLTVFSGVFLGLHFAFFFLGVRHTSIANATLLGNTGPFFTTIFALFSGERISKMTYLGLGLALLGVLIVQGSGINLGGEKIWGNSVSLLSGFFVGLSYVFSSKIREETENLVYGRSLFLVAAVTIGIIAFFMGDSLFEFQKEHIVWLIFLGLVPSILGHNMLNYAIKYLTPTTVASVPLGEPVIATMLGYVIFSERVPFETVLGGPIILCGIYIILKSHSAN